MSDDKTRMKLQAAVDFQRRMLEDQHGAVASAEMKMTKAEADIEAARAAYSEAMKDLAVAQEDLETAEQALAAHVPTPTAGPTAEAGIGAQDAMVVIKEND